jgi:hypothetical protein
MMGFCAKALIDPIAAIASVSNFFIFDLRLIQLFVLT